MPFILYARMDVPLKYLALAIDVDKEILIQ